MRPPAFLFEPFGLFLLVSPILAYFATLWFGAAVRHGSPYPRLGRLLFWTPSLTIGWIVLVMTLVITDSPLAPYVFWTMYAAIALAFLLTQALLWWLIYANVFRLWAMTVSALCFCVACLLYRLGEAA